MNDTAEQVYFSDWKDSGRDGMLADFAIDAATLDGAEVLFATYTYEDYSGSAFVLFRRDGKLYEVNGGHCSCYGLEDQWTPEETTVDALRMRKFGDLPEEQRAMALASATPPSAEQSTP